MTLPEAFQAYARALHGRHVRKVLRFSVVTPANDNVPEYIA
ncbi:hypothetical protein [Erythrobacter sp. SCSIO 43205]|nr:hypothetical protein [Erythrobacter sp. SCSIO 43205]